MDNKPPEFRNPSTNVFGDGKKLHDVLAEKKVILQRAHRTLDNPPEPYKPTPIAYGEHFASNDQILALVRLRQGLITQTKALSESKIKRGGKNFYYYNSGNPDDIAVLCADPNDDSSLFIRKVVDEDGQMVDYDFVVAHGILDNNPVTLSMGSAPEVGVLMEDEEGFDPEIVFQSERKREQHTISEGDAIIAGHLMMQVLDELYRVRGTSTTEGGSQTGIDPQNPQ